nr:hypothetical protein [Tanacetum cinerariifolium]
MLKHIFKGRLLARFQDLEHEGGETRSQGGIKDNDVKIKIQDHRHANDISKKFPRTRLQVPRKVYLNDHPLGGDSSTSRYVVPTGRVVVPTGRYVVPTGRIVVPTGRYVVPTGRVVVPTSRVVVPTGLYVVPTGRVVIPTGRYVVPTARVVVPTGRVVVPTGSLENQSWPLINSCASLDTILALNYARNLWDLQLGTLWR